MESKVNLNERLTTKLDAEEVQRLGIVYLPNKNGAKDVYNILEKLGQYEDTGLTPTEITEMNDFSESQCMKLLKDKAELECNLANFKKLDLETLTFVLQTIEMRIKATNQMKEDMESFLKTVDKRTQKAVEVFGALAPEGRKDEIARDIIEEHKKTIEETKAQIAQAEKDIEQAERVREVIKELIYSDFLRG